ncbi:FAD-dependent oxidoreductase [Planktotalea sp.]|uniref:NAD(P)/FAD-dependent oxidoreductase n=1 Tax=Planktotalea sp. TaxID=2029877 RepID=UPI00329A7A3F
MAHARQKIIVVGSGIIGAAAAFELQSQGADVLVISGAAARATDASFGWVNASFFENPKYFALRVEGIKAFSHLRARVDLPSMWHGSLCWEHTGAAFDEQVRTLSEQGYPCKVLGKADVQRLEPNLGAPPERAIHFQSEGVVEPAASADALLNAAVALGAKVAQGFTVTGFHRQGSKICGVQTREGVFAADQVLVAAGTGTQALLQQVDVNLPMLHRPALVLRTKPVSFTLSHVLVTDFGEVRQLPDGALITPAAIGHQADAATELTEPPQQAAERSMTRLRALFPEENLELASMQLAQRPVPEDGFPAVGAVMPGLYAATMHSGMTLAALMGDLIAREMLNGVSNSTNQWLGAFRPDRF